jgi:hypothetical protein
MAGVDITISGVLYDKTARTMRPVVIIGEATLTGLGVGGGPIMPQPPSWQPHPEHPIPPNVWPTPPEGSTPPWQPHPEHPIPPGIWPTPPEGSTPHPEHPIVLPPNIVPPIPPDGGAVKPPPEEGGWGYFPEYGWGYFPALTEPGPKKK